MLKNFHKLVSRLRVSSSRKNVLTGWCLPVVKKLTKMDVLAAVMGGRKQHRTESEEKANADVEGRRSFLG